MVGLLPWQSYGTSLAILDQTVLPATRYKWTRPVLTPARRRILHLPTYPEGIGGRVDLGYTTMQRPGVELATSRSQVRRPNHYTTETCSRMRLNTLSKYAYSAFCLPLVRMLYFACLKQSFKTLYSCYMFQKFYGIGFKTSRNTGVGDGGRGARDTPKIGKNIFRAIIM